MKLIHNESVRALLQGFYTRIKDTFLGKSGYQYLDGELRTTGNINSDGDIGAVSFWEDGQELAERYATIDHSHEEFVTHEELEDALDGVGGGDTHTHENMEVLEGLSAIEDNLYFNGFRQVAYHELQSVVSDIQTDVGGRLHAVEDGVNILQSGFAGLQTVANTAYINANDALEALEGKASIDHTHEEFNDIVPASEIQDMIDAAVDGLEGGGGSVPDNVFLNTGGTIYGFTEVILPEGDGGEVFRMGHEGNNTLMRFGTTAAYNYFQSGTLGMGAKDFRVQGFGGSLLANLQIGASMTTFNGGVNVEGGLQKNGVNVATGGMNIIVSPTAPVDPQPNDIWIKVSSNIFMRGEEPKDREE